jgi:aryl sulfotransferase
MNFAEKGARPGLYLLASYPKSGNTWARLLLEAWATEATIDINRIGTGVATTWLPLLAELTDAEPGDMTEAELLALRPAFAHALAENLAQNGEARWYKCHEANLPPPGAASAPYPAGVVAGTALIVRDPRDVAVSLARHNGIGIDEAIARMAEPARIARPRDSREQTPHLLSSWSEFCASWRIGPGPGPVLLRYEDMLADAATALARLLGVMGIETDAVRLRRAADACRFPVLVAQERKRGFNERPSFSGGPFFGEGRAGAWQATLTSAQRASIERGHGATMQELGYL